MPIKTITMTPAPGYMVHICAACGAEHTVSFDRGAQKTRTGPFVLQPGDTLVVRVDGAEPATATFAAGSFPDFTRVSAAQLAAKLNATLAGVQAVDDAGGVLIESTSVGPDSCVQIVDGTARAALGFATNGWADPCHSRPMLGISLGAEQVMDKDIMALRRCNDCGANECLVRTFDAAPAHLDGTHLMAHRQAVNSLAEHCKSCGWSHPDLAEHHAAELARPRDVHAQVLDQPVILPRFVHPVVGADVRSTPSGRR
jgi:hypothetical protein